ncbi:MAG: hypothetical protein U5R06_19995 [candidate division KSB1 bacterium]|nr:hypothetical protein [candidate division KSB1 bacterium]
MIFKPNNTSHTSIFFILSVILLAYTTLSAQPECRPWGNLQGIRVQGHVIDFKTSLCIIGEDLMHVTHTAKEKQRPQYHREGDAQVISTRLDDIEFKEIVKSAGTGAAELHIQALAKTDSMVSGVFLCLTLPATHYENAEIDLQDSSATKLARIPLFRRWNSSLLWPPDPGPGIRNQCKVGRPSYISDR